MLNALYDAPVAVQEHDLTIDCCMLTVPALVESLRRTGLCHYFRIEVLILGLLTTTHFNPGLLPFFARECHYLQ